MTALAVWCFDSPTGAGRAAEALERLGLPPQDAAVAAWEPGLRRPQTRQLPPTSAGALDQGFWGLLFGLIFFVPLLGAAIGATTGALGGTLADVGIDDHFMNRVRDQVTPSTSALFLLAPDTTVEAVQEALAGGPDGEPIVTALDAEQEAALREVFGN